MLLYVTRPYSSTYRSTIWQSSKVKRILTVSPAMKTFLILMELLERTFNFAKRARNLTDVFPFVGVHWQTYGCVTAA